MSDFTIEFPNFPVADMPAIPVGFADISWHNDACPMFRDEARKLTIQVDYAKPEDRESPDCVRFALVREDFEGTDADREFLAETDDWNEILTAIASTN